MSYKIVKILLTIFSVAFICLISFSANAATPESSRRCETAFSLSLLSAEDRSAVFKLCQGSNEKHRPGAAKSEPNKVDFQQHLSRLISLSSNHESHWQFWALVDLMPMHTRAKFREVENSYDLFLAFVASSPELTEPLLAKADDFFTERSQTMPNWFQMLMNPEAQNDDWQAYDTAFTRFADVIIGKLADEQHSDIAKLIDASFDSSYPKDVKKTDAKLKYRVNAFLKDFFRSYLFVFVLSDPSAENQPEVYSGFPVRRMPMRNLSFGDGLESGAWLTLQSRNEPFSARSYLGADVPFLVHSGKTREHNFAATLLNGTECIDVQMAFDHEDSLVLLDGFPLQAVGVNRKDDSVNDDISYQKVSQTVVVPKKQAHTISVLRKKTSIDSDSGPEWIVLNEETINPRWMDEESNSDDVRCHKYYADLRDSHVITLAPLKVESSCRSANISAGQLWGAAARFLKDRVDTDKYRFRDMRAMAETVRSLSELQNLLTYDAEAAGADRRDADTMVLANSTAKELWRQGISYVVSLELQCSQKDDQITPSLLARKVNIRQIYNSIRDPIAGADLSGIIELETEVVSRSEALENATRRVVSRLLKQPYLRFSDNGETFYFTDKILLYLEQYEPRSQKKLKKTAPVVEAFQNKRFSDDSICSALEQRGTLAGMPPSEMNLGEQQDDGIVEPLVKLKDDRKVGDEPQTDDAQASLRSYVVEIRPPQSGQVIIRAKSDSSEHYIYKCIQARRQRVILGARLSGGYLNASSNSRFDRIERPDDRIYSKFIFGVSTYSKRIFSPAKRFNFLVTFGPYIGTSITVSKVNTESGRDFLREQQNEDSVTPLDASEHTEPEQMSWTRRSVDVGFSVTWENSFFSIFNSSSSFYGRRLYLSLLVDVGIAAAVTTLDKHTRKFASSMGQKLDKHVMDMDVNLSGGACLGFYFSSLSDLAIGAELNLFSIDDALFDRFSTMERAVRDDYAFGILGFIRLRYGR